MIKQLIEGTYMENNITETADTFLIDPVILYYGFLNYINKQTNEQRVYVTGATDDVNLVGFLLNQKIKETNVEFLSFKIECIPYDDEMFETLADEDIFVNKNNSLQSHSNGDIFYDEDQVMLFEIIRVTSKKINRGDFKTDKEYQNAINEVSDIMINPLDNIKITLDFERLSKSTFVSCPIVHSETYTDDINEFLNSTDYHNFEESIKDIVTFKESLSDGSYLGYEMDSIFDEEWREQLNLLNYFIDRTDLFLTVSCIEIDENGTFGVDNSDQLLEFIEHCFIEAANYEIEPLSFSVIVRQYTDIYIAKNTPETNVGACIFNKHGIFPLSKKDIMAASLTCASTGRKIQKEKNVTYMSFNNLMKELQSSENKTVH